jgi:hypothetical protein
MNADGVIQDLQDTNAIAYTHKATDDNNIVNLNSLLQNDYIKNILKFKKNNSFVKFIFIMLKKHFSCTY